MEHKRKGKFAEFLDCLFLSDHHSNDAPPCHACAGESLCASQPRGGGCGQPSWGLPTGAAHAEGRARGISCSFSLSMKSNDFPTLWQPNPSHNSSCLGIWAPESACLCLLSSFLFILAPNRGFCTPLSPPNCCPPRLCQIPRFPRTCGEAAGKSAPGSQYFF